MAVPKLCSMCNTGSPTMVSFGHSLLQVHRGTVVHDLGWSCGVFVVANIFYSLETYVGTKGVRNFHNFQLKGSS